MAKKKLKINAQASRSPYYFDKSLGDAGVDFFQTKLCLVEAEWAGKPFQLAPWQAHDIRQIFGWRKRNGLRRYRFVRIWVPRKNGKTEEAAGLAHAFCIGDAEPGAQVFSHALDGAQASISFEKATRMALLSPSLRKHYEITATALFCPELMSSFKPLSGEAFGKHGLNPHAIIGDEAHAWRNGKLHTFLVQGMGARRQPIDVIISTAGEINTYGHELYEASRRILEDPSIDPETYVSIHEAEPDDDWTDPATWAKANPNLGVSLKREFLEAECRRAMQTPRLENDFKRYHLNLWVEQAVRWFPMRKWSDNTAQPNNPKYWQQLAKDMIGRSGFIGLDLGSTDDISALVWVFPPEKEGGRFVIVPLFFAPEEAIKERDSNRVPYKHWRDMGALVETPGNVTDYDFIEQVVMRDCERYKCAGLAIDRWNATQVAVHLQNEGLPVKLFGQGYASMGAPSKELERLFLSGQLEHGNHPLLRWMFGNATYRKDPAGNIKPDKERAAEKIDGVVASVMGLGLCSQGGDGPSVYTQRGALII